MLIHGKETQIGCRDRHVDVGKDRKLHPLLHPIFDHKGLIILAFWPEDVGGCRYFYVLKEKNKKDKEYSVVEKRESI